MRAIYSIFILLVWILSFAANNREADAASFDNFVISNFPTNTPRDTRQVFPRNKFANEGEIYVRPQTPGANQTSPIKLSDPNLSSKDLLHVKIVLADEDTVKKASDVIRTKLGLAVLGELDGYENPEKGRRALYFIASNRSGQSYKIEVVDRRTDRLNAWIDLVSLHDLKGEFSTYITEVSEAIRSRIPIPKPPEDLPHHLEFSANYLKPEVDLTGDPKKTFEEMLFNHRQISYTIVQMIRDNLQKGPGNPTALKMAEESLNQKIAQIQNMVHASEQRLSTSQRPEIFEIHYLRQMLSELQFLKEYLRAGLQLFKNPKLAVYSMSEKITSVDFQKIDRLFPPSENRIFLPDLDANPDFSREQLLSVQAQITSARSTFQLPSVSEFLIYQEMHRLNPTGYKEDFQNYLAQKASPETTLIQVVAKGASAPASEQDSFDVPITVSGVSQTLNFHTLSESKTGPVKEILEKYARQNIRNLERLITDDLHQQLASHKKKAAELRTQIIAVRDEGRIEEAKKKIHELEIYEANIARTLNLLAPLEGKLFVMAVRPEGPGLTLDYLGPQGNGTAVEKGQLWIKEFPREELEKLQVTVDEGDLIQDKFPLTISSGLWVLTRDRKLYVFKEGDPRIKHVSTGLDIAGSGTIGANNGKITYSSGNAYGFDNGSGHYRTDQFFLYQAIEAIEQMGASIPEQLVRLRFPKSDDELSNRRRTLQVPSKRFDQICSLALSRLAEQKL